MKGDLLFPCFAASVLLAGCGDSFDPSHLAGVYRLATVEGTPPPFIELATTECDQSIVGGVLVLSAEGTHDLNVSVELDCTRGGGDFSFQQRTYPGTFTVNDRELEFVATGSSEGDIVFAGRAQGNSFVVVDLPSTVAGLDPLLQLRFQEEVCIEVCPAHSHLLQPVYEERDNDRVGEVDEEGTNQGNH